VSSFSSHPCVVDILGLFSTDVASFVVVEYVELGSLEKLLESNLDFTWEQIFSFAIDICKGMDHVHKAGVVHRNLKPSNVLVISTSPKAEVRLKVSDFGLARLVAAKMTGKRGPVAYMAPELLTNPAYTNSVDVYSFGIILWQLIARAEPFAGTPLAEIPRLTVEGKRPVIPAATPKVLRDLLESLWNQDPRLRPTFDTAHDRLKAAQGQISTFPPVANCTS